MMAIAGSMTTAYRLTMRNGEAIADRTTFPSDRCTPPALAVDALRHWTAESVPPVVQGSDMATFWRLWNRSAD